MKQEIKNHWQTWIFLLSLGIILIIIYKALDSISYLSGFVSHFISIISPFLAGLLLAYLVYIPERKIEKNFSKSRVKFFRRNKRNLGIFTSYVILILIVIIMINFIVPVLTESINEFITNAQGYYSHVIETYSNLPDDSIFKTEQVYDTLKEIQSFDLKNYFSTDRMWTYIETAVGVARGVFDIFVAIIVSIYILAERDEILKFIKKLLRAIVKPEKYIYIEKYFNDANEVFFKFITGQFVDAIVVGILTTIAMKIMGIKYASLLGFVIGLFNMIPYFGAIIAIGMSTLITIITGGMSKAIGMLIVVIILQQIDANIINPKIVGDSLKISPILIIIAVTIGGAYFGAIGMFLAVPIAAVIKILVNDYIDNKLEV